MKISEIADFIYLFNKMSSCQKKAGTASKAAPASDNILFILPPAIQIQDPVDSLCGIQKLA